MRTSTADSAVDFADIQEAYEVLGDVARRYLYDINYQELLQYKEEQRLEEQARREARRRAAEAAVRERQRHQLQPPALVQPQLTSPSPPPSASASAQTSTMQSGVATLTSSSVPANEPMMEDVEETASSGDSGSGVAHSSTAPSRRSRHSHADGRKRGRGGGGGGALLRGRWGEKLSSGVRTGAAGGLGAMATAAARLSSQKSLSTTLAPTFLVTNSIAFAAEGRRGAGAAATTMRAAGGRPGSLQDEAAERPIEHFHQRSIERTPRVFFDKPRAT